MDEHLTAENFFGETVLFTGEINDD